MLKTVFLLILFFNFNAFYSNSIVEIDGVNSINPIYTNGEKDSENQFYENAEHRPNPLVSLFRLKQKKNKRITAALLAFPFPFGIVGLHRIYLGCAPYVPIVYIGSLGGIFGLLPLVDFCILILDADFEKYSNNNQVFMWVK